MATTSIWRVNGWLGKVLIYIENPDKTENPDFFEKQDMDGKETQGLADVIEYAVQQQKTGKTVESEGETVMRQFVSGVNCSPSTARDEMMAVKKRFGKEDGTVAYHGYQSFAPGEATPELAHEIGLAIRALPPARPRRSWPMRSALPWQKSCGVKNTRCWWLPIWTGKIICTIIL